MNVSRINTLSVQHKALKEFLAICIYTRIELTVKHGPYSEVTLDYDASETIINDLRTALRSRISDLEKVIKKEATKL